MSAVHKVSIALTGKQIINLRKAVATGGYATISEVVREAIRDWKPTIGPKPPRAKTKIRRYRRKIKIVRKKSRAKKRKL